MKFARVPVTTASEHQAMVDQGIDFCDGCGGRFEVVGLEEAQLETEEGFLSTGMVCGSCRQAMLRENERISGLF